MQLNNSWLSPKTDKNSSENLMRNETEREKGSINQVMTKNDVEYSINSDNKLNTQTYIKQCKFDWLQTSTR